jgi:predicted amidohydrolase YtcJ
MRVSVNMQPLLLEGGRLFTATDEGSREAAVAIDGTILAIGAAALDWLPAATASSGWTAPE